MRLKLTRKKVIISSVLIILLSCTIFLYKFMWGKPFTADHLYLRTFAKVMLNDPELMTTLGLINNSNLNFYNDDLTDVCPEHEKKKYDIFKNDLETLSKYDRNKMSDADKLSYDIFEWYLQNEVRGDKFKYHNYPVNQFNGIQNELPDLIVSNNPVNNKKDAKDYIERLSKFDTKFEGLLEGLKLREENGVILPRVLIDRVISETKDFIPEDIKSNVLLISFKEKVDKLDNLEQKDKVELYSKAEYEITTSVYPSYKRLIEYLEQLRKKAGDDVGAWALPDGDAYYAYKLKSYTTTDLSPERVHEIGLTEVRRIEAEMKETIEKLGYKDISPGDFMKQLANDSRFKYEDSSKGKKQVLSDYEEAIKNSDKATEACFDLRPSIEVEVRPVPEFKQDTAEQAYLVPGSSDGTRPSVLYINVGDVNSIMKYNIKSMTTHETIPGHHIQRGIQRQLKDVPMFRTAVPFTAFAEGWAMYSERLFWEQNTQKDPYDNLGRLQFELWRAARLVVDTGIHHKKWTRQQAIDYMVDTTGMALNTVTNEVDRYIVEPGQACAYTIGMLKHLELREKAKNELGDKFDIKQYHNAILRNGAMPLEILEKQVDQYIMQYYF